MAEWNGWFCNAGSHIVTNPEVQMHFRSIGEGATVADCDTHRQSEVADG